MSKDKELVETVLKQAKGFDGKKKLSCAAAFEIAREFETDVIEIGRICNQYDIRISQCQLGCFR